MTLLNEFGKNYGTMKEEGQGMEELLKKYVHTKKGNLWHRNGLTSSKSI